MKEGSGPLPGQGSDGGSPRRTPRAGSRPRRARVYDGAAVAAVVAQQGYLLKRLVGGEGGPLVLQGGQGSYQQRSRPLHQAVGGGGRKSGEGRRQGRAGLLGQKPRTHLRRGKGGVRMYIERGGVRTRRRKR